ncbi:hypothetical protein Acsp04_60350 [Actinomadura sp. NBRC 104425]|uniref:hypothetical protein n=1 Tax=Actinomadura sp. NBRC 104425 TaxID=3032204 RepID=UPI0024A0D05C|nr:hypothetical protein [Actinomadura sp. NBRC 104425]GLZ15800.1 hypothetical protein Acsp04_60350 [Actinomadura sp. NBRC 104425]
MTAPSVHAGPVLWDTAAIAARLQRRYRVPVWWDDRNAVWMAMVLRPTGHPAGDQVVAAVTPAQLERRLAAAGVRPVPQPRQEPGPRPVPGRVRLHGRHEAPRPPLWRRLVGALVQLDDDEW